MNLCYSWFIRKSIKFIRSMCWDLCVKFAEHIQTIGWVFTVKIYLSSRSGAHGICPMGHGILWWKGYNNCHLGINSRRGNKKMAPPQASSFLLPTVASVIGLLSTHLVCPVHRLPLKLEYAFKGPQIPLHLLWTLLEQPPQKMGSVLTPSYDFGVARVDPNSLSFHFSLPKYQLGTRRPNAFSRSTQCLVDGMKLFL